MIGVLQKVSKILVVLLLVLLPWHGVISVFFPSIFSFWKECILILLLLILLLQFKIREGDCFFKNPSFWAVLFLFWLLVLVGFQKFDLYAIISARYLGMGVFVFLVMTQWLESVSNREENDQLSKQYFFPKFFTFFIYSCTLSVLFGIWMKFFGGIEILKNFYAQTISSWVPGQTIPIYHEVGNFIRMQGASSGPIEFSHLLVSALFLFLWKKREVRLKLLDYVVLAFLFFGIFQSFSRAALVVSLFLAGWFLWKKAKESKWKKLIFIGLGIFSLVILGGLVVNKEGLNKKIIQRAGTSQHFTRPIEALKLGMEHPLIGDLASIGPSARQRNLILHNDDKALIAENIFIDIFVQTGIVGLLMMFLFFVSLWRRFSLDSRVFLISVLLLGGMATIFDMTPISISYFLIFACLRKY